MATEENKVVFGMEVKGAEKVTQSFKSLKQELRELRDAQGYIKEGSKAWKGLSKSIEEVEGKIGDLNDSFKTLTGSGVERVNNSIGLFKEGLLSLDTGKISAGLKGLGAAFKAVLPFALIEGLKMLYENWDEVVKVLSRIIPALDSTSKATHELATENERLLEANKQLNVNYQNQITLLEALGGKDKEVLELKNKILANDIKQLEIAAQLSRSKELDAALTDTLYEKSLKAFNLGILADDSKNKRLKETRDETIKVENELAAKKTEATANRINSIDLEIKKTKEHSDSVIKNMLANSTKDTAHSKEHSDYIKREQEKIDKENEHYKTSGQNLNAELERRYKIALDEKNAAIAEQAARDKKIADDDAFILATNQREDVRLENDIKKNEAAELLKQKNAMDTAVATTQSLQSLSDTVFSIKNANLKKGSAEEEKAARNQFKINKALAIASATLNGANSILAITSVPDFTLGVATALRIAAQVGTTAAVIAKISASQFASSGGGDTSAPSIPSANVSSASPTTQAPTTSAQPFTRLDENGRNQSMPVIKAYVVENEMTQSQGRVKRLEGQASFG